MINSRANVAKVPATEKPLRKRTRQREPRREGAAARGPSRRTEQELRRREQNLLAIIENTPECIKIVAGDGTIVSMNPAGLALVEAESPGAVVGRSVFDLISAEFRDAFRQMLQRVCAGEKGELEYEITGLKGGRRWMHTRAAPIPHPDTGQPAQLAITRDITERKQAQRTINLNEERLRLASFSEAITLFEQDSQLRYTWLYPLKPQLRPSLGHTDSEILQNQEGALLERIKSEVMRTGQSQRHVVSATFSSRKTYYDLLISPRRNAEGQIIGVAGSALDITERKNAEEALRTSELRWRTVTETLPNLVWSDLPDGQCDWLSTQWGRYTGVPEKELLGLVWLERVIHPDDRERTLECWRNACADKAPYDLEYRIRRHDGQYRWFKTRGVPIRDDHGQIVYWFGTCTDIQDLKQAEANLTFLTELSNALTSPESATEIATVAARLLCRHFRATRVNFSGVNLPAGEVTVFASERGSELKEDRITHRLREYLPESILSELAAGRVVAIEDVRTDARTAPFAANYAQWAIGAMILSPHLTESGWEFLLVLHKAGADRWRPDELKLVPEITARIHNRIERARALEALRASETHLRELIEALPAAVYTTDAQGRITLFNQAAVEFSGRVPQIGTDSWCVSGKLYTPDGRPLPHDQCPMAVALKEGRAVRGQEAIAERPDGTRIHFIPYPTPVRDKDGKVSGGINMLVDITPRKRAEEKLRESEERFRNIFNQSTAGIAQVGLDLRYTLVNQRFCEITGYSAAELQAKTCAEITFAEDRAGERAVFENALRDGKPSFIELRYVRPDGSMVWVRNHISQMKDAEGRVCRLLAVSLDITEQKRAQEIAARLAAIVEHSDDAIFSTDLDGVIHSWNRGAERLYGYSKAEVVGCPIAILAPEGYDSEQARIFEQIGQGQTVENYETIRRRKNGTRFHVSLTVSPVKDPRGLIIGVSKVARDITEKVRAREILEQTVAQRTASLEQALAQMEDFTYTVSHDLRAPARTVRGISQAALEDFGSTMPAELRGFLEKISRSAERMDQLIRDILDYSRVSRAEVKLWPVQLDPLVAAIISERPEMQPQHAQIKICAPLGPVLAHEPSLAQALTNLLANAVKFVPPGATPKVEVRTERNSGSVRLWVADNGIGVNPKYQHRLFKVFERAHDSALYQGTGIGLAIVRKAAEKMGGKVGVVSDGLTGSSFWIELPAVSL